MADAGVNSKALLPLLPEAAAVASQWRRHIWKVEFARYFTPPLRGPSTPPPPGLRYVSLSKHRHPGAWLPAATPAAVCVSRPSHASASAVPVLTVSIADVIFMLLTIGSGLIKMCSELSKDPCRLLCKPLVPRHGLLILIIGNNLGALTILGELVLEGISTGTWEEHFLSILNFSWPQVTCVTQCSIRGSRVVFVSFRDNSKQIQKFALRFPHLTDAESFVNCVKECPGEVMDIIPSGSQYMFEDSPASDYIAYNGLQHRPDDASSFEERASDHRTEAPALFYHVETDQSILEPLCATNVDNISSGFPPSFTEMLTNFSTKNLKDAEETYRHTGTEHAPQEAYTLDTSHDVIVSSNETTAGNDNDAKSTGDIMERIKLYMADDSFHDMLFKLERVIDELGGDLSV